MCMSVEAERLNMGRLDCILLLHGNLSIILHCVTIYYHAYLSAGLFGGRG